MIQELVKRYPVLDAVKDQIEEAYKILETCYENGGKLLIAGNGGSAADSDHIVGEPVSYTHLDVYKRQT